MGRRGPSFRRIPSLRRPNHLARGSPRMLDKFQCTSTVGNARRIAVLLVLATAGIATGCRQSVTLKETPATSRRPSYAGFFEDVTQPRGLPTKVPHWPDG